MDYNQFKTAAYKYRYEAAIETDYERISYGELLERVGALYNSFCQMGMTGKTVAVLTGNCPETVYAILACLKAGCRCVLCRVSGPLDALREKLIVYRPSVAVLHACHFAHSTDVLKQVGCTSAVVAGQDNVDTESLPSVHFLNELLEINNYIAPPAPSAEGNIILANDGVRFDTQNALQSLDRRDGVYIGLPLYCGAGFDSLFFALLSGHKCVFSPSPTKQFFKKKNVKLALLYKDAPAFDVEALFYENDNTVCINCEFIYIQECEKLISDAIERPVSCFFDGNKFKTAIKLFEDDDIKRISSSPIMDTLTKSVAEALYGVPCPKSVVFKK